MEENLIVGIDFGTSTTVVRYRQASSNEIHEIKGEDGKNVIPSFMLRCDDGTYLYGNEALTRYHEGGEGEPIENFKLGLIRDESKKKSEGYILEFMGYVHELFAKQTTGYDVHNMDIYVSCPAKWDDVLVSDMKKIIYEAGFIGNIKVKMEPEAAVANSLHTHLRDLKRTGILKENRPLRVLMLDMGAGTSDISIFTLKIADKGKPIIEDLRNYPTAGNPNLCGGSEVDKLLSDYVTQYVKKCAGENQDLFFDDLFRLCDAKQWKEANVSRGLKRNETIKMPSSILRPLGKSLPSLKDFSMNRKDFEKITIKHWENLYDMISSAVLSYKEEFNIGAEDIDLLLLTGGHSNWYTVQNMFNGEGISGYIGVGDYKKGDATIKALNFKELKQIGESWRMFPDALPSESVARGLCVIDEMIEVTSTATNNVWARIAINGISSDTIEIVRRGETLPTAEKEVEFSQTFRKNAVFGDLDFKIEVDIYTGERLDSATHRSYKFKQSEGDFGFRLMALLFFIYIFLSLTWVFKVSLKIKMNDDNTLDIVGFIDIDDGRKRLDFTNDDFDTSETQ